MDGSDIEWRGPRAAGANLEPLRAHNILVGGPAFQAYETYSARLVYERYAAALQRAPLQRAPYPQTHTPSWLFHVEHLHHSTAISRVGPSRKATRPDVGEIT